MKIDGKFELESIEVQKTLGNEIGIYFAGEEQKRLAFSFDSAKKAISCAKKLKKVLNVKYNITTEVETLLLNEKINKQVITERGGKTMANKKRNVNVKQLCRDCIDAGTSAEETKAKIAAVYTDEGKDEKYAQGRAKAVYSSIRKEKGLAPVTKVPETKTVVKAPAEETPIQEIVETAEESAVEEVTTEVEVTE